MNIMLYIMGMRKTCLLRMIGCCGMYALKAKSMRCLLLKVFNDTYKTTTEARDARFLFCRSENPKEKERMCGIL